MYFITVYVIFHIMLFLIDALNLVDVYRSPYAVVVQRAIYLLKEVILGCV